MPVYNLYDKNLIFLSTNTVLDKETGQIQEITEDDLIATVLYADQVPFDSTRQIENLHSSLSLVYSVDSKLISFDTSLDNASIENKNGYLIEVYESGSDGRLSRLYAKDIVDPISDQIISEGFNRYFTLEVDVDG